MGETLVVVRVFDRCQIWVVPNDAMLNHKTQTRERAQSVMHGGMRSRLLMTRREV
jgi:hypothetical protein